MATKPRTAAPAPAPVPPPASTASARKTTSTPAKSNGGSKPKTASDTTTAIAKRPANAVAVRTTFDIADVAGSGFEGADSSAYALPFLLVLQKGSPQVDETAGGVIIPGAKPGFIFNTVTQEFYDGRKGVELIPVFYSRTFIRWGARGTDTAGFKGTLAPETVDEMLGSGQLIQEENQIFVPDDKGNINPKKSDQVRDTRQFFVLVINEKTRTASEAIISITSTQIKKIRGLMPAMRSRQMRLPNGAMVPQPMWLNRVRMTVTPEQNDQGSWYGMLFTLEEKTLPFAIEGGKIISDDPLVPQAAAFHSIAKAGQAKVSFENLAQTTGNEPDAAN